MFSGNKHGVQVLAAASILNLFLGMIYIWGIFVIPVSETLMWDAEAVKLTASFKIGFFSIGGLLGGYLQQKMRASRVIMTGGVMMSFGALLAAFTPASFPWLIYITYGILSGLGGGVGYICTISAAQKWFPNHRGIATGICVGVFGLSVTIFAPILSFFLREFSVQTTFFILSAAFLTVSMVVGRQIEYPTEQEAPPSKMDGKRQFTIREMMQQRAFYHLVLSFFLVTVAFFVVTPAVQTLSLYRGFSLEFATMLLMITGIANTAGRFLVPVLSDKMRNEIIVLSLMVILMTASLTLTFASGPLFVIMVTLIPICFGAALSVFPIITADYFGLKNIGSNYGVVGAMGFATSALIMPGLIGMLGSYTVRFVAVSALSAVGIYTMGWLAWDVRLKEKESLLKEDFTK